MELTTKQIHFLRSINSSNIKHKSINSIGRLFYKTDMSVYTVLEKFQRLKLVDIQKGDTRGGKLLIVTITQKGRRLVLSKF